MCACKVEQGDTGTHYADLSIEMALVNLYLASQYDVMFFHEI